MKAAPGIVREPLFASDFGRYNFAPGKKWKVIYPNVRASGDVRLLTEAELKERYPRAYDRLVYDLYGLAEEEIRIVESAAGPRAPAASEVESIPEPAAEPKPGPRRKSPYAEPPATPTDPSLTPEKAYADSAHFYGKEESPPYRDSTEQPKSEEQT
jgi:hypothetical protein